MSILRRLLYGDESKKDYGVISSKDGVITVHAPSGTEALRIAGMEGRTQAGSVFTVANHKGNGIFEVKIEEWPK